jgi:hypothetical protein
MYTVVLTNLTDVPGQLRLRGFAGNVTVERAVLMVRADSSTQIPPHALQLERALTWGLVLALLAVLWRQSRRRRY